MSLIVTTAFVSLALTRTSYLGPDFVSQLYIKGEPAFLSPGSVSHVSKGQLVDMNHLFHLCGNKGVLLGHLYVSPKAFLS